MVGLNQRMPLVDCPLLSLLLLETHLLFKYVFTWLHRVFTVACGIQFPDRDRVQAPGMGSAES